MSGFTPHQDAKSAALHHQTTTTSHAVSEKSNAVAAIRDSSVRNLQLHTRHVENNTGNHYASYSYAHHGSVYDVWIATISLTVLLLIVVGACAFWLAFHSKNVYN
jgi:hypothetical protein